ncbi:maleylpyruvate isomerase family mycothiol-dependent enzyme [Streptomyces sp. NPDC060194]|uniref:maleylpyruvate isomerase family mycothiol-dependent enzyme n=1 Tax=Streptomyces sp. NPDC060194 TaxID=3347069 RepID=UPI00365B7257
MIDHEHDLRLLRTATERLLTDVATLDNAALAEPSRLPGWTRGHVLAHLARNADALVNVFEGRPMYASAEQRAADIERDAPRGADEQLADVRRTHDAFLAATAVDQDWTRTVELRNGVTDSAAGVLFRRLAEIELHRVDLGIGYEPEDLPAEFTERYTTFLADRFRGLGTAPTTLLRSTDGRIWTTGAGPGALTVTGPAPALLSWLAGRRDGSDLRVEGGPLPALPPL